MNKKFEQGVIPSWKQICEKQLFNFADKIEKVKVNEEDIKGIIPSVYRKLDWLDKEDVIKRLISLEFNRLIDYYRDALEIENPQEIDRKKERPRRENVKENGRGRMPENGNGGRMAEKGFSRLFLNLGKNDGIRPQSIIGLLNDNIPGRKIEVGRIDLMKNFSFFEVREADRDRVIKNLDGIKLSGQRISVESAQPAPSEKRKNKIDERDQKFRKNDERDQKFKKNDERDQKFKKSDERDQKFKNKKKNANKSK